MAKIDKSQYSKEQWRIIKEQRRSEKEQTKTINQPTPIISKDVVHDSSTAFVLGNGTSRKGIEPNDLRQYGKIYGCNALYRTFSPDYLIAVDVKMILEITKSGYQNNNQVWTNPNKTYSKIENLNYFQPSKGWSSGPTALWFASQHNYKNIYILGFDYKGLEDGKKINNIYADTVNYKKSTDGATYFGNWLKQTATILKEHQHITYFRVIAPENYVPDELNKFKNLKTIFIEDFKKIFHLP
jgi:hypothetical protein